VPKLVIPYKPRPQFLDYHANAKRFAVSVCHRRAGKTVARINRLIKSAVTIERTYPPGRFGYLAPFRNQAKKIAWLYLKHYAAPLIQIGGKVNESELTVTMPHNGATIELYGADNADAMRGGYFDGITPDEAQDIPRSVLSQVILPCLADYQGWLDCSGTPKGWSNLLGELVKLARSEPEDWYLQILRASETGLIAEDELRRQRHIMSPNEYEQEFECSFDAAITGAVYGAQIAQADKEGRLKPHLPLVESQPVHTAWDLGYDDSTAIWWFQILQGELRILDYYENSGQDIPHYCDVVLTRGIDRSYRYGQHYVPHDAANELLAAGGRSIVQQAYGLGVKMFVVKATSQQNGIEATRKTLERCWFDASACEQGLEALRQYQFEFDPDKKVFRSKPRHDWASHGSDAFEIIGQVWHPPRDLEFVPKPRFLEDLTAHDLFAVSKRRVERI
jgi:phage terminase large subunit